MCQLTPLGLQQSGLYARRAPHPSSDRVAATAAQADCPGAGLCRDRASVQCGWQHCCVGGVAGATCHSFCGGAAGLGEGTPQGSVKRRQCGEVLVHLSAYSCRGAGKQLAGEAGRRVGVLQALRAYPRFGWRPQSSPQHGGRLSGGRTGCSRPTWPQTAPLGTPASWDMGATVITVHGGLQGARTARRRPRRCRRTRHKSCAPLQGPGRGTPGGRAAGWSLLLRRPCGTVGVPGQQPAPQCSLSLGA
jgi:hypothetical protein